MPKLEGLEAHLTTFRSVVMPLSSLSAMYFVYGLYTALFISYIRILRCRNVGTRERSQAKTLYLLPTIILFILTTLVVIGQTIFRGLVVYITYDAVHTKNFKPLINYLQHDPHKTTGFALNTICFALLNATADYILIHRCHTIWGSRRWITLPLAVVSIGTNVLGIVGASIFAAGDRDTTIHKNVFLALLGNFLCAVFLMTSAIVNILVTTLTAGRIWWMYRQSDGSESVYKSVLRIVIESGLIYPIFTLVHVITVETKAYRNFPLEFSSISYQTAGIAPTLVVVRAQLGKTVETMHGHDIVSEINFSSCPPPSNWNSGNDSRTQAPDNASNMQQAHESGPGSLDLQKDITSVGNREHAS